MSVDVHSVAKRCRGAGAAGWAGGNGGYGWTPALRQGASGRRGCADGL